MHDEIEMQEHDACIIDEDQNSKDIEDETAVRLQSNKNNKFPRMCIRLQSYTVVNIFGSMFVLQVIFVCLVLLCGFYLAVHIAHLREMQLRIFEAGCMLIILLSFFAKCALRLIYPSHKPFCTIAFLLIFSCLSIPVWSLIYNAMHTQYVQNNPPWKHFFRDRLQKKEL